LPRPTTPPTTPSDIYKPITVTGELFRGPGRCVALITDDGHRHCAREPERTDAGGCGQRHHGKSSVGPRARKALKGRC
jgi:hypothetical protein